LVILKVINSDEKAFKIGLSGLFTKYLTLLFILGLPMFCLKLTSHSHIDDRETRLTDAPVFVGIISISEWMVDIIIDLKMVVESLKTKLLCKVFATSRRGVFYA
jgi:hypothetical protein